MESKSRYFLGWIIVIFIILGASAPISSYAGNPFLKAKEEQGKFVLKYITPKKELYKNIEIIFKDSGQFESIIDGINNEFLFPENVTVKFTVGDGPVFYPSTNVIQMSYDFIFYLTVLYVQRYPDATDEEMLDFSLRATTFLFYHEMAHAFIDIFELPIVSNEETAADSLAVILALEFTHDGFKIVMDSAELFDLMDTENGSEKYAESDFWDEHALNAQRFYNILCMTYGKYPNKVKKRLKEIGNKQLFEFIDEKGDYCTDLYQQQLGAWSKLLNPHFKE